MIIDEKTKEKFGLTKKRDPIEKNDESFIKIWDQLKSNKIDINDFSFMVIKDKSRKIFSVGYMLHLNEIIFINRNYYASYNKSMTIDGYTDEHCLISGTELDILLFDGEFSYKETSKS